MNIVPSSPFAELREAARRLEEQVARDRAAEDAALDDAEAATASDDAPHWKEHTGTTPDAGATVRPRPAIITADALSTKVFAEPRWAVDNVLPEGATILVGPPKKGKSWFLLGLGLSIAAGGNALGKIPVTGGDVLLLCLEDGQRRLQDRMWRVLDGELAPKRLHLVTEWPRLDEGGDVELDAWLRDHPETRLVGIDVLARVRPPSREKGDLYQRDYETMVAFKRVADRHGVALVVVHHSRKASAEDPLDLISGTQGLAGAADTALILTREKGRADANLYVRGRDVPEADYALDFDPVTCQWNLLGDAKAFRLSTERESILDLLRSSGPLDPKSIAERLNANRGAIRVLLHRMKHAEEIVVAGDGLYSAPPLSGVTGVTPPETDVTARKTPVTPPVTGFEGVTPPVTGKMGGTTPNSRPVTPVTPEPNGHVPPAGRAMPTVRVTVA
jgi:hypothetical protein